MNKSKDDDEIDELGNKDSERNLPGANEFQVSPEDLKWEEDEIRELEKKKRALEDRVSGMERDLGGLSR